MKRNIIQTRDGSTTIHIEDWDECYHSRFGAIQEAQHVFIKKGLSLFENKSVSILEIGFGTGLNAFITFLEFPKFNQKINYVGVEAYPVTLEEAGLMNYVSELKAENQRTVFEKLHQCNWEELNVLNDNFVFTKRKQFFADIDDIEKFDLIYFDAFGYDVQPELWTAPIFKKMFEALKNKGILVTYAARGVIKRNMIEAGFTVEKLEGAPEKEKCFGLGKGKIKPKNKPILFNKIVHNSLLILIFYENKIINLQRFSNDVLTLNLYHKYV